MSPSPRLSLRAASLDATHAVAAALAGVSRAGDIILLAGEMGAGKTAFAQGFGRALGVTEPITSPTFTLVHSYDTGRADAAPRRPLPPRAARRGRRPGARRARRVRRHRARRVGRCRRRRRSASTSSCASTSSTTTSTPATSRIGADRPDVGPPLGAPLGDADQGARRTDRPIGDGAIVLILGIETATEQVSVALGGHEGVIALFEVGRGRRHAEILTPAIDFVCAQADIGLDELGLRRRRRRARAVHRHARRPGDRQGAGPGAAHPDDRDLLARPAGVPAPALRPRRRARHRRPQGRGVLRHVPPGAGRRCSRSSRPRVGPVDELVADLLARSQEALCVGDGAQRYRAEILDGLPLRDRRRDAPVGRTARAARPRPGAARGVGQPRRDPARCTCASPTPRSTGRPAPARRRHRERARPRSCVRAGRPGGMVDRADAAPPRAARSLADRAGVVPEAVDDDGVPRRARPGRAPVTATTSSPAAAGPSSATPG